VRNEAPVPPLLAWFVRLLKASVALFSFVFGATFAGVSGYVFYSSMLPAWRRYASGDFSERESVAVLIFFTALALLFFVAGVLVAASSVGPWRTPLPAWPRLRRHTLPSSPVRPRRKRFGVRKRTLVEKLELADGSVRYSSRSTYRVAFYVVAAFGLFWNGVIFAGVRDFWGGDGLSLLMLALMLPFALVGIGLFGAAVYLWMVSLHPTIEITLLPGRLKLGGVSELTWKVTGDPKRLSSVTLLLECLERATEGSGDDETTRSRTFFRSIVAEQSVGPANPQGRATVRAPAELAPSFESDHHEIAWQLVVKGKAENWPDLLLPFPLEVVS